MADWQPIETAPKDGSVVLGWHPLWKFPQAVCWQRPSPLFDDGSHFGEFDAWVFADWLLHDHAGSIDLTHWMPLPTPPEAALPDRQRDR